MCGQVFHLPEVCAMQYSGDKHPSIMESKEKQWERVHIRAYRARSQAERRPTEFEKRPTLWTCVLGVVAIVLFLLS